MHPDASRWFPRFVCYRSQGECTGRNKICLGRHLMSVHRFPQRRPAVCIWPCLSAAASLPPTPTGRMETPLGDQGTQAPPVELSGQVGELAAELGVGWTGEGNRPPGVDPEAARHPSPQPECAETVRVSAVAGPSQWGSSIQGARFVTSGVALIRRATFSSFRTTRFFYDVAFRSSLGLFFWHVKKKSLL